MGLAPVNPNTTAAINNTSAGSDVYDIPRDGWYLIEADVKSNGNTQMLVFVRSLDYEYAYLVRPPFNVLNGDQYTPLVDTSSVLFGIGMDGPLQSVLNDSQASVYVRHFLYLEKQTRLVLNANYGAEVSYVGKQMPFTEWSGAITN